MERREAAKERAADREHEKHERSEKRVATMATTPLPPNKKRITLEQKMGPTKKQALQIKETEKKKM